MAVLFPDVQRRGLGIGLDLPWDAQTGFGARAGGADALADSTRAFLNRHAHQWSHLFFSLQFRDRAMPRLSDYERAWESAWSPVPDTLPRALHHTALNLGALGPYERRDILEFTRALCERFHLRWVNEDVGLWSLAGRPVPYPLPPALTRDGLLAATENVQECQAGLTVPLVLEFPGFDEGLIMAGAEMDAYDFFRRLAEDTSAPVTLDLGHLLSWRWCCGRRGSELFEGLERLPLAHVFELHLAGCEVEDDRWIDAHHGRLMSEQFELLRRLMVLCPNLKAITFEDPRFDASGEYEPASRKSWDALVGAAAPWCCDQGAP